MGAYILRRLALMVPTLLGIMLLSFMIIQFAPGGPVEKIIAQLQGQDSGASGRSAAAVAAIFPGRRPMPWRMPPRPIAGRRGWTRFHQGTREAIRFRQAGA